MYTQDPCLESGTPIDAQLNSHIGAKKKFTRDSHQVVMGIRSAGGSAENECTVEGVIWSSVA